MNIGEGNYMRKSKKDWPEWIDLPEEYWPLDWMKQLGLDGSHFTNKGENNG